MKTNTFLEKLLQGAPVEWKTLGEVTLWDKRFQGVEGQEKVLSFVHVSAAKLKSLAVENGDITLLSTGNFEGFTNREIAEEFINSAEVITIPTGGTANIKYHNGLFVDSGNLLASSTDSDLYDLKYIYYFLKNINHIIQGFFRGSGVKHPSMPDILKIQIPIPPPAVQKEIVRILDALTAITSELTSELTLRQKQYQHYRDQLLTFGDEVEWKTLGEVDFFEVNSGGTPSKSNLDYWNNGNIPWIKSESCNNKPIYSANNFITEIGLKESSAKLLNPKTTLIALVGATIFKTAFLEFTATTNQNIASIKSKVPDAISDKFIFYYITNLYNKLKLEMNNYGMLNLTTLRQFKIPIPSIKEQKRIISILDKFDTLTNSLSDGLPKEIKLRQKQYEYYRDLLLGFDNLK
ncbi:MAG TPA: restriction endonuclease subunit S [Gallibacterium anatis]|uniref:Restriction endonuclease subunit S n=1 Tax=Gallibacterium anatis TaxID=750 RepID=A0A921HCU0_9PAST|nr:restriction endonuclease subunit S [Gallibacterium anatis]